MYSKDLKRLGYVPELDGMRALAILVVMFLHAHFQLGKNGYLGVDIFFTLSGFLITTLLIEEFNKSGRINFVGFYIRRTFRLFPALYLIVLFLFSIKIVFHAPDEYISYKEIIASVFYFNNIAWDFGWTTNILGHTWSLGVEEQFYIAWPAVLYFFIKNNKAEVLLWLLLGLIGLLLFTRVISSTVIHSVFNESIFIGCFFALLRYLFEIKFRFVFIPALITLLCFGMLPIPFGQTIIENGFRSVFGLLTGFVILGALNDNYISKKLLSFQPLVFIGKISYSLYLWHLPVFRLFSWYSHLPPYLSFILKFVITFIVAILSFYILEKRLIMYGRKLSKLYDRL